MQTQAQFDVLPERLGPGRLLEQTWTRRLLLAIGAVILVALLFDVSGLLRPVVVIAVAPLIGGILLRSVWWIVLYPLGLAAVLVAAGQEVVRDAFNISAPRPSWAELGPPGDYLNDVFAAINYLTPNDIQERLTQESLGLFDPQLSYIRSCELGRDFGSQRELCTTADWNILVLAALCALIGTMLGKLVFRRPDVPTC